MGNPWVNGKFTYDMSDNLLFKKDENNYINALGIQQLNTIGNIYLLDIYLSENNYVDLHYHPNASELTYCISGGVEISFINPTTNEWQQFFLKPGDVVSIPQGFWHCARATEPDTHILATHDTNNLQTIFGADLLRITPKELMANIYCLDETELANVLEPIKDTIVIGPPVGCKRSGSGTVKADTQRQEQIKTQQQMKMQRPTTAREQMKMQEQLKTQKQQPKEQVKAQNQAKVNEQMKAQEQVRKQEQKGAEVSRAPMFPMEGPNVRQSANSPAQPANQESRSIQGSRVQPNHYGQTVYTCPICKGKQYRNK